MNLAIVFAGGTGRRMKSRGTPKQFLDAHGKPIIIHTLEVLNQHPEVDAIAVPCVAGWHDHLRALLGRYNISKVEAILPGGDNTQESKLVALDYFAQRYDGDDLVILHDAVRPLITEKMISDNLACARVNGNAISFVRFNQTAIVSENRRTVLETVSRQRLFTAAAPQTFRLDEARQAHLSGRAMPPDVTIDTCSLMAALGKELHLVECETPNIKISTSEDFYHFKAILSLRESRDVLGL